MTLAEHLKKQRIKHIISSYQLNGSEVEACENELDQLLERYPSAWIELALADAIAHHWAAIPMPRGLAFFNHVHESLQQWERTGIFSPLSPDDFQHITGLNPSSIFEPFDPPPPSMVRPH
jgi:hypothetical protein